MNKIFQLLQIFIHVYIFVCVFSVLAMDIDFIGWHCSQNDVECVNEYKAGIESDRKVDFSINFLPAADKQLPAK